MVERPDGKIPLVFFESESGKQPVREWFKTLDVRDRLSVGQDLMRAQWRWPAGMPLCRPMGRGLWEIRLDLGGNRIARVFLCLANGELVALHAFIKKTQKTPEGDLALARKRLKELMS